MQKTNKDKRKSHNLSYLDLEIEGSDKIAKSIFEKYVNKNSVKLIYERQSFFIIECLKKYGVKGVCDIGCGFGNFLVHADNSFSKISGVDPAPESIKIAKQLIPGADLRVGQGENLPFKNDELDSIVLKGVVHHLKDPTKVFGEAYRCLKSSGILLIYEGNHSSVYRRVILSIADYLKIHHETTLFEHRAPKIMKQMLVQSGFQNIIVSNISGLFTPMALTGMGKPALWRVLFFIENILQRFVPGLFNYHVMIVAKKNINSIC